VSDLRHLRNYSTHRKAAKGGLCRDIKRQCQSAPVSGFGYLLIVLDSCESAAMARSISTRVFTFHEPGFEQNRRRAAEARRNIKEVMPDTVS
jgi:hypothetical protein